MKHSYFGRKLSRTKNERKNLFRNLMRDLIVHGSIKTTLAKAKAIQSDIEKLITKAKVGSDQKKREVLAVLPDKKTVTLLWQSAGTQFANRTSGFTRIIKLGPRRGDAGEEVLMSFVDQRVAVETIPAKKEEKKKEEPQKAKPAKEVRVKKKQTAKKS